MMIDFNNIDFSEWSSLSYLDWKKSFGDDQNLIGEYDDIQIPILTEPRHDWPFDIVTHWFCSKPKITLVDLESEFLLKDGIDFFTDLSNQDVISDLDLHGKGASASLEIAALIIKGISSLEKGETPKFQISIGSEFFYYLAKVRAFSFLWWRILEERDLDPLKHQPEIEVISSIREQSLIEPEMNILRNFTTALVGTISGVTRIAAFPHTLITECKPEEKLRGQRLARNMALMAAKESYLSDVHNAVSGSSLIELITEQLVLKSWQEIITAEASSNRIDYLGKTDFKKKVLLNAKKRTELFASGKKKMVGVNHFVNPDFKISRKVKSNSSVMDYQRLSEPFEQKAQQ